MIELYLSTVNILAPRPTHISAVATVLLITTTFTVKYHERIQTNRTSIIITTERVREREREEGEGGQEIKIYK